MNNENPSRTNRLADRIAGVVNNRKMQFAATIVVTAAVTRELTLRRAFTFDQMNFILSNEELTKIMIDSAKES